MNKKIMNRVIEAFSPLGYSHRSYAPSNLTFISRDGALEIEYDDFRRPFLSVKELRFFFIFRYGSEHFMFDHERLKGLEFDVDLLISNDLKEHEQNILKATDILIETAVPLLEEIRSSLECLDINEYELLSQDTVQQAKEFAERYGRDLSYTQSNMDWAAEWLSGRRSSVSAEDLHPFGGNLREIIAFTAYIGEMIRSEFEDGCWTWYDSSDTESKMFIVYSPSKGNGFDPLSDVVQYWNFNSFVHHIDLFPR